MTGEKTSKKRPGEPLEAPSLFVVYSVSPDGDEGIFGIRNEGGEWLPLVTSRRDNAAILFERARPMIELVGERARLVEFKRAAVLAEGDRPK
jgi:hypothetical protein